MNGLGDGDQSPDGAGVGTSTAQVRAERSGSENGRVYNIRFIAQDDSGAESITAGVIRTPKQQMINSRSWRVIYR